MAITSSSLTEMVYPGKDAKAVAMIVNPLRWPEITDYAFANNLGLVFLYDGTPPDDLIGVLPYFVELKIENFQFEHIYEAIKRQAIIFVGIKDTHDFLSAATHIKNFGNLIVEGGRRLWARYYEPYVLSSMLQTFTHEQRKMLFGNTIDRFIIPDIYDDACIEYKSDMCCGCARYNLVISNDQFEHILDDQYNEFVKKCAFHLSKNESFHHVHKNEIFEYARLEIEKAESVGVTQYEHVFDFVMLSNEFGTSWSEADDALHAAERAVMQSEKMDAIRACLLLRYAPTHTI